MGITVEFENDRVRVLRVRHPALEHQLATSRGDRVIVYLEDGHVVRTEDGKKEEIQRKAGDVVWRDRSHHQVENRKDTQHEVVIVELKK